MLTVVFDGVVYSSWLFLMAAGLTLIYGVMRILNIAHGSLYAIGACGRFARRCLDRGGTRGVGKLRRSPCPRLVGLVMGPLIERGLLKWMYGKDEIVLLLVTYALFLMLEDAIKLVWGVESKMFSEPYALLGNFQLGGLAYPPTTWC